MRILFTGGSGKAGRHVAPMLAEAGHRVLNADLVPLNDRRVDDLRVDLTDAGQVYGALHSYAGLDELTLGAGQPRFDAVVHFAALARILIAPDGETYRVNTQSTYNVIEAATRLGVPKVIFASSETTYGICFADGERLPEYLPVDEDHPTVPEDAYAMSKVANEACARGFQRRTGLDIYGLRINNVIEPHEYARDFPGYVAKPERRLRNIFGYIDVRDLGRMVLRCLEVDGLGYEVFNVANDDTSVGTETRALLERFYPGVPERGELGRFETLYSNAKARRMLGFEPVHGWRDEVGAPS
ncbi:NAD-dependent epimerase/dehydratase family protein [Citreimonas salinaria]|uniref:Nucleoside-diphosphate-sugar epimerase n=1 Tax=Citreimonas salinaria TaxID=321339 RepID=A0A1H3HCE6_9RHOB|nr:NAD(P)-dependent oxidoreductase [Citreimonas salinaria]SDY12319.1 Nucleoside-diphosphate-sugar epimerase [Citreimonas salinaria]